MDTELVQKTANRVAERKSIGINFTKVSGNKNYTDWLK